MRVLILCVGSRGDAEPFCALAANLLQEEDSKEHHVIDFFVQPELQHLVPQQPSGSSSGNSGNSSTINVHLWPFTQTDFYKAVANPKHGRDHAHPRVRFVGIVADIITDLVLPCAQEIAQVVTASKSQVIVTSALARQVAMAVGLNYNIPVALVHLQPLLPTNYFPHSGYDTGKCVEAILRLTGENGGDDDDDGESKRTDLEIPRNFYETYLELERHQHEFLQQGVLDMHTSLGIISGEDEDTSSPSSSSLDFQANLSLLCGESSQVGIFNCFASGLIPDVTKLPRDGTEDGKSNESERFVYQVGALADAYVPSSFVAPDDDLVEFLGSRKPICVGFGSMPFDKLTILLDALEAVGHPVLLVGTAMELPTTATTSLWVKDNVRQVDSLPYVWLLPQCRMMLSHGGAGVLHATLRAGIPPVIAPFMGDQFFHAELVEKKGLGVRAGSHLASVTKEELVTAIRRAESDLCVTKARAFAQNIQSQPLGVNRMCDILKLASKKGAFPVSDY